MNMLSDNIVKLVGKVTKKQVNEYANGSYLFKCALAISAPPTHSTFQYINVSAWTEKDSSLLDIENGNYIKIFGHIEKHSYKTNCRYCNGQTTTFWTDVVIDNYIILGENNE